MSSGPMTADMSGRLKIFDKVEDQMALNKKFRPQLQHFYLPENIHLPIELIGKKELENTGAYLCHGTSCLAPIFSLEELLSSI